MNSPSAPSPEAMAAAKELHHEQWHGLNYDQMIAASAVVIDRHFGRQRKALEEIGQYTGNGGPGTPWQDIVRDCGELARAAVMKNH